MDRYSVSPLLFQSCRVPLSLRWWRPAGLNRWKGISSNFKIRPSNHIGADKGEEEAGNKYKTHLPRIVHHQARHQPGESLYNQSHYILMIQIEYILPGEMRLVKRFPSTTSSFVFFALASVLRCGLRSNSLSRPLHDSLRDLAPPPRGAEGITFNFTLSILSLYHYNKMENSPRQWTGNLWQSRHSPPRSIEPQLCPACRNNHSPTRHLPQGSNNCLLPGKIIHPDLL